MKFDCIFWDWNGTLYDDADASKEAVNRMLAARGMPRIDLAVYRERVDIPIRRFYEKTFDMTRENMDDLAVEFNAFYRDCLPGEPLRPGAADALKRLSSLGARQFIFSSSANAIINGFLERHGISGYFEAVLGSDDYYVESKVERTVRYISEHGIDPSRTVFIGDMEHDAEVADACGGECIFITGGHRPDEMLYSRNRRVVTSFDELIKEII